jgi:hypothetical protein
MIYPILSAFILLNEKNPWISGSDEIAIKFVSAFSQFLLLSVHELEAVAKEHRTEAHIWSTLSSRTIDKIGLGRENRVISSTQSSSLYLHMRRHVYESKSEKKD